MLRKGLLINIHTIFSWFLLIFVFVPLPLKVSFVCFFFAWNFRWVYFWITPKSRRHAPRPFSFVLILVLSILGFSFFGLVGGPGVVPKWKERNQCNCGIYCMFNNGIKLKLKFCLNECGNFCAECKKKPSCGFATSIYYKEMEGE